MKRIKTENQVGRKDIIQLAMFEYALDILDALSHVDETAYFNCVSKERSTNHECKVTYTHVGMQFYCSLWQYAIMPISFFVKY